MTRVLTPRESAAQAIGKLILDFRYWLVPETSLLARWKTQQFAYLVAEGRMIDDAKALIDSMRKAEMTVPALIFAIKHVAAPPDLSQVVGVPFERKVILPSDPLKRQVLLRTEPRTYHIQFMFLCNDPDSANAFSSQFASYIRLIEKRRIHVEYFLSPDVKQAWHLTIFDNSIYPDEIAIEETNLTGALIDFDMSGLVPRAIKGLPPLYPEDFGPGSNVGGDANNPNNPGNGGNNPGEGNGEPPKPGTGAGWGKVLEANIHTEPAHRFIRVKQDPVTGLVTEELLTEL